MKKPKRYEQYREDTMCSVPNCDQRAEYEVYLYDFYSHNNHEFFEQDFTCPFLCARHMDENEQKAKGARKPRGVVSYPYTNQHMAQGYIKYAPLARIFPQLYTRPQEEIAPSLITDFSNVNAALIAYLVKYPEKMRELDPRKFEELVAELFKDMGFGVELTPRTRDGGKDIYAVQKAAFGTSLYVIECKRYASHNKVGVEVVRALYGTAQAENATMGVIATTSSFTPAAVDFATPVRYRLSLRDYDDLTGWLNKYGKKERFE